MDLSESKIFCSIPGFVVSSDVAASTSPVDYGLIAHGTLMAGILVAEGHQTGAATGVSLGVAAALGADDDGGGEHPTRQQAGLGHLEEGDARRPAVHG